MNSFLLSVLAAATIGDVGFHDSRLLLKTVLSGPKLDQITFFLCPIEHQNEGAGQCLRLSSCSYRDTDLEQVGAKIPDKTEREEFQLFVRADFMSKLTSDAFISRLLKILPELDQGRNCLVVSRRVSVGVSRGSPAAPLRTRTHRRKRRPCLIESPPSIYECR